jgi:thermostable 8-oxoguanine DNA glycosylase
MNRSFMGPPVSADISGMINPTTITKFNRSTAELEEFAVFSVLVAGNNAVTTAKKLDIILRDIGGLKAPFRALRRYVKDHGSLLPLFTKHRVRHRTTKAQFVEDLIGRKGLDLRTASVQELESIKGIAEKTSRFFVMHSRPHMRIAALDTHILQFMTDLGLYQPKNGDPKKNRPKGKRYLALEESFLDLADQAQKTPAELDLQIWNEYSGKNKGAVHA